MNPDGWIVATLLVVAVALVGYLRYRERRANREAAETIAQRFRQAAERQAAAEAAAAKHTPRHRRARRPGDQR